MEKKNFILGLMSFNKLDLNHAEELFLHAYSKGVRYFDLADIYGEGQCEKTFGEVLVRHQDLRKNIIIQTKCGIREGYYDFSYSHIVNSVKNSLKRLSTNYIDVLLFHRPDVLCDFDEFKKALIYLKENGLVRSFGVSNMNSAYIKLLKEKTGFDFIINQVEFSITSTQLIDDILNMNTDNLLAYDKSGDALVYCYRHNIALQAWSPLKISLSKGSFINNDSYKELNIYLDELANIYNTNKVAIALSFIYRLPFNITPVVGTSSIKHLDECLDALNIKLDKKEWYKLYLLGGHILP